MNFFFVFKKFKILLLEFVKSFYSLIIPFIMFYLYISPFIFYMMEIGTVQLTSILNIYELITEWYILHRFYKVPMPRVLTGIFFKVVGVNLNKDSMFLINNLGTALFKIGLFEGLKESVSDLSNRFFYHVWQLYFFRYIDGVYFDLFFDIRK